MENERNRKELANPLVFYPGLPVGNAGASNGFIDWIAAILGSRQ